LESNSTIGFVNLCRTGHSVIEGIVTGKYVIFIAIFKRYMAHIRLLVWLMTSKKETFCSEFVLLTITLSVAGRKVGR